MTSRPSKATDRTAPLGRSDLPTWSIRYRKTPRLATQLYAARFAERKGTSVSIRTSTAREKVNVNMNTVNENFVTGSRKTMAMMRGVSCVLASCTATSSAEETKTMNVNMADAIVPSTVREVSGLTVASHPNASSIP